MSFKSALLAVGIVSAVFCGVAQAQTTACAEDDLKCRIAALEARLDALTGDVKTAQAKADTAAAAIATKFTIRRACAVSCVEEAKSECQKRGFANGSVKDMERQRSGPAFLTRVSCSN